MRNELGLEVDNEATISDTRTTRREKRISPVIHRYLARVRLPRASVESNWLPVSQGIVTERERERERERDRAETRLALVDAQNSSVSRPFTVIHGRAIRTVLDKLLTKGIR